MRNAVSALLIGVFLFFNFSGLAAGSPEFDVMLSKDKVKAGESFKYRIKITIETSKLPEVIPPEFQNFRVVSQSTSQRLSAGTEGTKVNVDLQYILVALEEGRYDLPQAVVKYENQQLRPPLKSIDVSGKVPEFEDKEEKEFRKPAPLKEGTMI